MSPIALLLERLLRAARDHLELVRDALELRRQERCRQDVPDTRDIPGMPNSEIDRRL